MPEAFICDAVRTPIGRYGGTLSSVRTDDLAALSIAALLKRSASLDPAALDEVVLGCANQAGEDNRNRRAHGHAFPLAGLPVDVPAITVNRLCASWLDAAVIASPALTLKGRAAAPIIAGRPESMSRAPFVMPKADTAFSRQAEISTRRSVGASSFPYQGPVRRRLHAGNGRERCRAVRHSREDQDSLALRSQ